MIEVIKSSMCFRVIFKMRTKDLCVPVLTFTVLVLAVPEYRFRFCHCDEVFLSCHPMFFFLF